MRFTPWRTAKNSSRCGSIKTARCLRCIFRNEENPLAATRRTILRASAALALASLTSPTASAGEAAIRLLADLERDHGGRIGVAVTDDSGSLRLSYRAEERFPLCSTFKAIAAAAILARVDAGSERLDRLVAFTETDLVTYSPVAERVLKDSGTGTGRMSLDDACAAGLTWSDNTAGNLMLQALGGPEGITAYFRTLGDSVSRLDRTEPTLNTALPGDPRDTTCPGAMAVALSRILLGDALAAPSRDRLEGWMVGAKTGLKRLRAGIPADWRVGDKTGTGDNGTANVVAILRPPGRPALIAAIYLTGSSRSVTESDAVHARIGQLIAGLV